MVNRCSVYGCRTNHDDGDVGVVFGLKSVKELERKQRWFRFCNRPDLRMDGCIFVCEKHFGKQYIKRNKGRLRLRKKMFPVSTIQPVDVPPSCLPTITKMRKQPTERVFRADELPKYQSEYTIHSLTKSTSRYWNIAGFVAHKLQRFCEGCCKEQLVDSDASSTNYHNLLSRGGLKIGSVALKNYVASCFATLDACETVICKSNIPARHVAEYILKKVLLNAEYGFTCINHEAIVSSKIIRIVTNIFFNNQWKRSNEKVIKDRVGEFKKTKRTK